MPDGKDDKTEGPKPAPQSGGEGDQLGLNAVLKTTLNVGTLGMAQPLTSTPEEKASEMNAGANFLNSAAKVENPELGAAQGLKQQDAGTAPAGKSPLDGFNKSFGDDPSGPMGGGQGGSQFTPGATAAMEGSPVSFNPKPTPSPNQKEDEKEKEEQHTSMRLGR